jgi:hypothetical protein
VTAPWDSPGPESPGRFPDHPGPAVGITHHTWRYNLPASMSLARLPMPVTLHGLIAQAASFLQSRRGLHNPMALHLHFHIRIRLDSPSAGIGIAVSTRVIKGSIPVAFSGKTRLARVSSVLEISGIRPW